MSPHIKYPNKPAQITPEYLKGATRVASPYRNVSIIRKCAKPTKSPLIANNPQSTSETDTHMNGIVTKLARMTPKVV